MTEISNYSHKSHALKSLSTSSGHYIHLSYFIIYNHTSTSNYIFKPTLMSLPLNKCTRVRAGQRKPCYFYGLPSLSNTGLNELKQQGQVFEAVTVNRTPWGYQFNSELRLCDFTRTMQLHEFFYSPFSPKKITLRHYQNKKINIHSRAWGSNQETM